jgi:putative aldouronate transport system permease protein
VKITYGKGEFMKLPIGDRIFRILNYAFLAFVAFLCLYPFLYVLALSTSSSRAISSGEVFLWPVDFNLDAYRELLRDGQIFRAMGNTVIITCVGTALNMAATILCAYAMSKKRMRGLNIFTFIMVFTMMFGGGMIPEFLLIRNLRLMETYWALWLPGLISTYNMIVLRTFFQSQPVSLEEAAMIDGASDPYILIRIVLPLSAAALATIALFYAVGWWNTYFSAVLYLHSPSIQPLMVKLNQMLMAVYEMYQDTQSSLTDEHQRKVIFAESFKAASIVVTIIPILLVYPFLQKHFTKGVMIGSLKG